MSMCCILLVIIIIIVCLIVIFIGKKLYDKINNALDNKSDKLYENVTAAKNVEEVRKENFEIPEIVIDPVEDLNDFITFSIFDNNPAARLCEKKETDKKCEYMEVCNIYLCKHLTNNSKIHTDKNTLRNVTYIHINKTIVVFISKNENVCSKEQDVSLEDINYINAYTSKHPDFSVYIVFYDKETTKFKDFNNKTHSEMKIPLNADEITREIFQSTQQRKPFSPSAPAEARVFQNHHQDNQGNFFYIGKQ